MKNWLSVLFVFWAAVLMAQTDPLDVPMSLTTIKTWSPIHPVLIGKDRNPLLRIEIVVSGSKNALELTQLGFDLSGTDQLKDLDQLSLFFTGPQSEFDARLQFGSSVSPDPVIYFEGLRNLQPGSNYLWLSCNLNARADLLRKIVLKFISATIDGRVSTSKNPNILHSKRIGQALRQHGQDGVNTYRIPGLVTTNRGTLIAVYDVRHNDPVDLQGDIDIGMSRSIDGGQTWEPMQIVMDMGRWGGRPDKENGIGDPSVLVDRATNTLWVAALWLHGHQNKRAWFASQSGMRPEATGQFMLTKSFDDGLTWSEPINITSQIKDPTWELLLAGPGKGITLDDGTLVFPAQFKDSTAVPHSTILYSKDHGQTWHIGVGAKSRTTESQLVELSDHSIMLNMRDDRGSSQAGKNGQGARSVAITHDLGQTWIEHPSSRSLLPEPVCMASLIKHRMSAGDLLIFSNPRDLYTRKNLTVQVSLDEGRSWPKNYHLLLDEGIGRGYSCLTMVDQETVGIIYEGSQADLVFQKIKVAELIE